MLREFLEAWTRLATTASEGRGNTISMSAAGFGSPFGFGLRAGATELTLRGNQSDWPMGSQALGLVERAFCLSSPYCLPVQIAISATEFPQPPATTETEAS